MRKYIGYIITIAIPLIVGFIYYRYYGTTGDIWSKQCSFHELTGLQCPGCGGQRAFYFLLHGDILQALRYNLLLIIILPFLLYIYFLLAQVYILKNKNYLKYFNFSGKIGYIFIAVLIVFFILRNIPASPFSYLSPP
ncbi:DUF2752 domain-containing protein [Dysgonomonas sp. 521]|uniref:DUF2752 domain-containing protein n=1 Tax=Dysgonomonas sp. 521 TaxID=2302932 RepID=UPI0013D58B7E|nr:DUF2752 domain-containing protein [Dysgonomonas sp. 521]NDV94001.1 DUF2752 domain-containing protein [Dysgonomonas sp. 521]